MQTHSDTRRPTNTVRTKDTGWRRDHTGPCTTMSCGPDGAPRDGLPPRRGTILNVPNRARYSEAGMARLPHIRNLAEDWDLGPNLREWYRNLVVYLLQCLHHRFGLFHWDAEWALGVLHGMHGADCG